MKFLILIFLSLPAFAEYEFEKSKFNDGVVCQAMVVEWYTDVTITSAQDGKVRHITRLI